MRIILITLIVLTAHNTAFAKEVPYYASISASEANVRTGPSVRYPIQWTYRKRHWPVEVTATFERWRKISDIYGETGWIHESLLSRRRYALVQTDGFEEVYRLPLLTSAKVFIAEDGVLARVQQCRNNWCNIETDGHEGWIQAEKLWGVYPDEEVE